MTPNQAAITLIIGFALLIAVILYISFSSGRLKKLANTINHANYKKVAIRKIKTHKLYVEKSSLEYYEKNLKHTNNPLRTIRIMEIYKIDKSKNYALHSTNVNNVTLWEDDIILTEEDIKDNYVIIK